jgi:hypothetical protein
VTIHIQVKPWTGVVLNAFSEEIFIVQLLKKNLLILTKFITITNHCMSFDDWITFCLYSLGTFPSSQVSPYLASTQTHQRSVQKLTSDRITNMTEHLCQKDDAGTLPLPSLTRKHYHPHLTDKKIKSPHCPTTCCSSQLFDLTGQESNDCIWFLAAEKYIFN